MDLKPLNQVVLCRIADGLCIGNVAQGPQKKEQLLSKTYWLPKSPVDIPRSSNQQKHPNNVNNEHQWTMFKILWLVFCKITLRQHRKHLSCRIPWSQVLTKGSGYMHVYANLDVNIERLSVCSRTSTTLLNHVSSCYQSKAKHRFRENQFPPNKNSLCGMWHLAVKYSTKIHINTFRFFGTKKKVGF